MAKSETNLTTFDESENEGFDEFDAEALLAEDLSDIPEEQKISGTWHFTWISATVRSGHSEKGPWAMINIALDPTEPVDQDAAANYDLEDLPRVYHRVFYTKTEDRRQFVKLAGAFGVEAAPLSVMLSELRGQSAIANAKPGTDRFGRPETKMSGFRSPQTALRAVA